ncbi:hypothetical protein Pmar_PMAR029591 [Perkinsus marinus ATCC 50983]|uniref:Uncharacterized protein n=1 Tax=Perkinsus marinus (strain ATCC 50983 / TXsc) TaxID=423536 RepID=C5KWW7_PERM5|nr:hypothetical protein Pmar_PMAR029591 [Perkinsus marinus ATCC 50983]EER10971.1 hypothetical protein Pmar_PMAR029591 [Perkinsus marinus ATCC 50983]|eukprot:XP_002779176.1 hypothetical protein Pmar_PMAR029591 [Perkinsus marinus ATCC 50983]
MSNVLKALAEVRSVPKERLKAVEERLLTVIRREEEYRDRRLKGKGEPRTMPPPSLGIQVALQALQKLAAIHATRVGVGNWKENEKDVTKQLIGELVRRVRAMAVAGDLDPHDISAAYVSLEKALGRNNAATRELENILVTRGLSDLSEMEVGRLADVVHPGTPLQQAVAAEFGERSKLSKNQKACRITITNLMQFISNIDPMLGSARLSSGAL